MVRNAFGAGVADAVWSTVNSGANHFVSAVAGTHVTMWSAATGGTQYTDLLDANGAAVTYVTSTTGGQLPSFSGPSGVTQMWADAGGGVRVRVDGSADSLIASFNRRRKLVYDIRDYGAQCDGVVLTDAAMTVGSKALSTAHTFTSADVGKTIAVMGAGTIAAASNDGVLVSTIASVASGVATLTANAVTSCSGARAVFGTPDDDAFDAARDAAVAAGGGVVQIPAGHTIVTRGHSVRSYTSYIGLGRELSWVHPIFYGPNGGTDIQLGWLTADQYDLTTPLTGLTLADFGVEAEGMAMATGATYSASLKPLSIHNVKRCVATRLYIKNSPATSIPFDESVDACEITFNVVRNPGRLAAGTHVQGASGIGMGIIADGSTEPTLVMGNSIFGVGTASVASPGQNGIFVEAQVGSDYTTPSTGYRITGNYVEGMTYGISDRGGWGTVITHNVIKGCNYGIFLAQSDFMLGSFPGMDTLIQGNHILNGTGPAASDGNGIRVLSYPLNGNDGTNLAAASRTRILDNLIESMKFRGIALVVGKGPNGDPGVNVARSLDGIIIRGNRIRSCGRSGIIALLGASTGAYLSNLVLEANDVESCGTSAVAGDQAGITVSADLLHPTIIRNRTNQCSRGLEVVSTYTVGLNASGGRIQANDFGSQFVSGTIDPWVEVTDNDTTNIQWSDTLTGTGALISTAVGTSATKTWASASGQTGGTAAITRNSDGVSVPSNADGVHVVFGLFDTGKANHFAQVSTAGVSAPQTVGVVIRATNATNYWRLAPDSSNANKWTLQKTVSGSRTNVAAYGVQAASDTVRVICSGDTLIVTINGVAQTPVTDSFNDTATLAGIFMSSTLGSTVRLTSFYANAAA